MKIFKVIVSNTYSGNVFSSYSQPSVLAPVMSSKPYTDDFHIIRYFAKEDDADVYLEKISAAANVLQMTNYINARKTEINVE